MLKKLVAGAGAVAVVLCWPLATGQIGERIYMEAINSYHSPYLTISNQSYDRGYLSSDAISKIVLKDRLKAEFEAQGLPTVWLVKHQIDNGYFGIQSTSELEINKQLMPLIKHVWGENITPIKLVTDSSLSGNTAYSLTISPLNYKGENNTEATSQAFVLSGDINSDGKGQFSYQLPSLNVTTNANETMVINGFQGSGKGYLQGNFWIGNQSFKLDSADFSAVGLKQHLMIRGLDVDMNNTLSQPTDEASPSEKSEQVTNTNSIKLAKLVTLEGQEYSNFDFQLALKNLNYDAISRLAALEQPVDSSHIQAQVEEATSALDLLVAKGATVDLSNLSVTTPDGNVKAHLLLELQPGLEQASKNIGAITTKLAGNMSMILPVSLAAQEPQLSKQLNNLVEQKIMTKEQGNYQLTMRIVDNQLELGSGVKMPLSIIGLLLQ